MSIDIRCYTTLQANDLQKKLDVFSSRNTKVFPEHYVLYRAQELGLFDKEISNEYGLDPNSFFRMSVSNKRLDISTDAMADMIRKELGSDNVIVLLNGEDLI